MISEHKAEKEVPTCVKKACATTKNFSFHQVRDLMRSRGCELELVYKLVFKPGLTEDRKMWKVINCWKSTTGEAGCSLFYFMAIN